ncbi:DUF4265 domain-containing protein [Nitratireductor pacificus]|uniref:DUF4265 domain-containing protein n=1 Tax=Nitratireductor pacificus pht-3B TaxID=391937 RepID=K2MJW4_9HYPH|nr:DUF4265 domain-containing protein [Nitratireductor pacificus]EKF17492.1 hypothetical protein NA2_17716 [Nitratireductor pacificus pht-3B]
MIESVHTEPVWRERSDFIIAARLPEADRTEQLWARQVGDHRFEICCIPFFTYNLALADIVETDHDHEVLRTVSLSGRSVFRVWFGGSAHPQEEIVRALAARGALVERSSGNLIAVDAADRSIALAVRVFLDAHEKRGHLAYETGN